MRGHIVRNAYYVRGEGVIVEPSYLTGGSGCPFAASDRGAAMSGLGFGRMFPKSSVNPDTQEFEDLYTAVFKLGNRLNTQVSDVKLSDRPAGYTYLGQFIAHEITFDKLQTIPRVEPDPTNVRSPSIDLDSLYGIGDEWSKRLYDEKDPALLKVGATGKFTNFVLPNDLPRDDKDGRALIGDPRNDENLAVAQMHIAFIKFHNKIVADLRKDGHPEAQVFKCARAQVSRHFQWLVLHDFLGRFIEQPLFLSVLNDPPKCFKVDSAKDLYMPLEFSAAAFRLGHSMVSNQYLWNDIHTADGSFLKKPAKLTDLFHFTEFSGVIGHQDSPRKLPGDWVIDWRRFFPFEGKFAIDASQRNLAARIDTNFDFHFGEMLPPPDMPVAVKPITVRNLLRGLALRLPSGEDVAKRMQETPLTREQIVDGPQSDILSDKVFEERTPLWYYVLKEAELNEENRLGPIGGRIVAETLVGLIKNSPISILKEQWQPDKYARFDAGGKPIFEMIDLLEAADVVNPYGSY